MSRRRRKLREMAADPRFISGIHNYCDRWCERCPLTSRCLVFAMQQEEGAGDPAARDITNQAFWTRMEEIFRETREMLEELMQEHGITLDPADLDGQARQRERDDEPDHPCAVAAKEYGKAVEEWFGGARPRFQARGEALMRELRMGLPGADPEEEAKRLEDAVEVIRWYQYQIAVKVMRAVGSARREDEIDVLCDQGDADGSAKVALIGIDRSLAAWSELLRQLPDEEDRILPLLAALSRLRREVEGAFPGARAFLRPGFDTGETAAT
ncbi:MAG TPA: hypothetical protein VLT62_18035 [Candidatus Methylomirabilis sp.]|nr:hypothetical protein [Candidatus Methylomirabilis sp.]